MASSPSVAAPSSKPSSASSSTSQFQNTPAFAADLGARRSGGSGSFGAGNYSRQPATAKNPQNRRQHKQSRKFRFDEDAIAESVSSSSVMICDKSLTLPRQRCGPQLAAKARHQ
jgi:hypothetical protein